MKPSEPIGRFNSTFGVWELTTAWACELSDGSGLLVHPGARSDGASIPRILWPLVGPRFSASGTFAPAFTHDMLYAAELVPRAQADREFYRLLRLFGVPSVKAWSYYMAVRAFGWTVWRSHTSASVRNARRYAELIGRVAPLDPLILQQLEASA